jgi:phage baseplate assembly protein W
MGFELLEGADDTRQCVRPLLRRPQGADRHRPGSLDLSAS